MIGDGGPRFCGPRRAGQDYEVGTQPEGSAGADGWLSEEVASPRAEQLSSDVESANLMCLALRGAWRESFCRTVVAVPRLLNALMFIIFLW